MKYSIGTLVSARGREWIVLPDSTDDLLLLKPLGGSDAEITGILQKLEEIKSASFTLPNPELLGDFNSCNLLRNALKLSFRNTAGPFRSFGKLAVDPRPYQLVPLMMALKLNTTRLLIADDVGVGKTIEAGLILKELLDRGEISRFTVLCPPHLAEQWQSELKDKFHLEAELVLASTVRSLEKQCTLNQSIFDIFPYTIVSIDYIKSDKHRDEFLRNAPEFIIVDEAHTVSFDNSFNSSRHQRHELVKKLGLDDNRHMIFVTATPHSGNEQAFRSLLTILNPVVKNFPEILTGSEHKDKRETIAQHFIQRRRADIVNYLDEKTSFPVLESLEEGYKLSAEYQELFNSALEYAREIVQDKNDGKYKQRVRWWSALALLRSLASSPAAAMETMNNRCAALDLDTEDEVNEHGKKSIFDVFEQDGSETSDILPGSDFHSDKIQNMSSRQKLHSMAEKAQTLFGDKDNKLITLVKHLKNLLSENYHPIVFCRFIQTAEYLTEQLKKKLPRVEIKSVTGLLPPEEREIRVQELSESANRILVCTDCLSEGINLQEHFNAVIHYDLSWNPTRHEQREGRVDRFGQKSEKVRTITYFGKDNRIDGIVLDVLIRKHKSIKSSLGISVPVPANTESLIEAIFEGYLLKEDQNSYEQGRIEAFDEYFKDDLFKINQEWDKARDRESRSRTIFAQDALSNKVGDVQKELSLSKNALGTTPDLKNFVLSSLGAYGAVFNDNWKNTITADLSKLVVPVKEACGYLDDKLKLSFTMPVGDNETYISRTHPIVEGLADYVLNTSLDEEINNSIARRCGVSRTSAVTRKTTLLLVRYRFHLWQTINDKKTHQLVEDCQILAFTGTVDNPEWLSSEDTDKILKVKPDANVIPEQSRQQLKMFIDKYSLLEPEIIHITEKKAQELKESHTRVREAIFKKSGKVDVKPELPPDVLGVYVYLPTGGSSVQK